MSPDFNLHQILMAAQFASEGDIGETDCLCVEQPTCPTLASQSGKPGERWGWPLFYSSTVSNSQTVCKGLGSRLPKQQPPFVPFKSWNTTKHHPGFATFQVSKAIWEFFVRVSSCTLMVSSICPSVFLCYVGEI